MKHIRYFFCISLLLNGLSCAYAQSSDAFYDALGGKAGVRKISEQLLIVVRADSRIKAQFVDIDEERFLDKLSEQICELSGGPCQYSGKSMEVIHDGMKVTVAQFNALAEDLQQVMTQQAIPNSIQNRLIAKLAPMQRAIVGK